MELRITLFESIGPFKLGVTQETLHANIGGEIFTQPFEKAKRGLPSSPLTDYFTDYDAKVEYGKDRKSIFIEVGPISEVVFEEQKLFDLSYKELWQFFLLKDPNLEIETVGLTSLKYRMAIYAPQGVHNPKLPCELISIFVEGYYDTELY